MYPEYGQPHRLWLNQTLYIKYTTGLHMLPLIPDSKDNRRHGPEHEQECDVSARRLCAVHEEVI